MRYLKSEQYYYDLYDRYTIERCKNWGKNVENNRKWNEVKDEKSREIMKKWAVIVRELALEAVKGERYINRESTVQKWINDDKEKDELLEKAIPPKGVHCTYCNSLMEVELKELGIYDENRILFMYRCSRCQKGRAFYDNGEEWKYVEPNCPKCGTRYTHTNKNIKRKLITLYECPRCNQKEEMIMDLDEKYVPEPILPLNEIDKKKYCLDAKEGQAYITHRAQMKVFSEDLEKEKEREANKALYDKVATIKRLKIAELEKILVDPIQKQKYSKFQLGKPELGKYVIVEFHAEDNDPQRLEYNAKQDLQKVINKVLAPTNWRLMSGGISYRVGFLTGRLRCYENEEDLVKLLKDL